MAAVMKQIRAQLAAAHGHKGMLLAAVVLRDAATAAECRRGLAHLGVRIGDEAFDAVEAAHGDALAAAVCGSLEKRNVVVDMGWARVAGDGAMEVTVARLFEQYDTARHERVDATVTVTSFAECWDELTAPEGVVSKENFTAYYIGVSLTVAADRDFQLLVMRSWNLDRPAAVVELAAASATLAAQSAMTGRKHALYHTSSNSIGTNLEQAFEPTMKNNRAGHFTKHAPPPAPTSGMNTSTTRTKV
jgi:hypothetical protein